MFTGSAIQVESSFRVKLLYSTLNLYHSLSPIKEMWLTPCGTSYLQSVLKTLRSLFSMGENVQVRHVPVFMTWHGGRMAYIYL